MAFETSKLWDAPAVLDNGGYCRNVQNRIYGAKGDGVADDTSAIIDAITAAIAGGCRLVYAPPGIYRITEPIVIANARSIEIWGGGFGHDTAETGTVFLWDGDYDETMFHLLGFAQGALRRFAIDGNGKSLGIGIHMEIGTSIVSSRNNFESIQIANSQIGMKAGVEGEGQGNNDQVELLNMEFKGNDVGVDFQSDQAVGWMFHTPFFHGHSVAAIRTGGDGAPNSGAFNSYGGSYAQNACDFLLPRVTNPIVIEGARSEGSVLFLSQTGNFGDARRLVSVRYCWQNSADASATKSIEFTSSNSLEVIGGRMQLPIEVGCQSVGDGGKPVRRFRGIDRDLITRTGSLTTHYVSIEDAPGDDPRQAIAAAGTYTLGPVEEWAGAVVLRREASDQAALYLVAGTTVTLISGNGAVFDDAKDNASTTNLYIESGNLVLQNNTASTQGYRAFLLGGETH